MNVWSNRRARYYVTAFVKHDLKAGITVFFVALPLCLGVALASGAPLSSGLIAGIVGGMVVTLISGSALSVSGPAAGLTAICAAAIAELGSLEHFFLAVSVAGLLQVSLGLFRLGGFTHFIPSAVIKGMLTAIGIILISKQIPQLIGYDQPDFWANALFNILTLNHLFSNLKDFVGHITPGAAAVSVFSLALLFLWKRYLAERFPYVPASFVTVLSGALLALFFEQFVPLLRLSDTQFVQVPERLLPERLPDVRAVVQHAAIWRTGLVICFVASLESLLSLAAIDKLDPLNRVSPHNRELLAQGAGNFFSGLLGGLPITSVIVRSAANAEAGARTRLAAFSHGVWLVVAVVAAAPLINRIPYAVLAVILVRTGMNLAKPRILYGVYRQGREQFLPYIVTVVSILFTDLLIGVLIGIGFAIYFLIHNTYRAGFTLRENTEGHIRHFTIQLDQNVSFLNKRKFIETLDKLPEYCTVDIIGTNSIYIDQDVLEIFHSFKSKAHRKHIALNLIDIPDVETIEVH